MNPEFPFRSWHDYNAFFNAALRAEDLAPMASRPWSTIWKLLSDLEVLALNKFGRCCRPDRHNTPRMTAD